MPSLVQRSIYAEASLAHIASRVSDYRKLTRMDTDADPRLRPRLWRPIEMRHANAIVDLLSIVESFVSVLLLNLRPEVSSGNVLTWKKRENAWAKHASVGLANYRDWSALMGFAEVRNALQHGLGKLTERQLVDHRTEVLAHIKSSQVNLNGDRVMLSKSDVERCEQVCVNFVEWLDSQAPTS